MIMITMIMIIIDNYYNKADNDDNDNDNNR